jgi:hypothetical protein
MKLDFFSIVCLFLVSIILYTQSIGGSVHIPSELKFLFGLGLAYIFSDLFIFNQFRQKKLINEAIESTKKGQKIASDAQAIARNLKG